MEVGIGNLEGQAVPAEALGGAGWCCFPRGGVGCPLGWACSRFTDERYKSASWTVVCYCSVHRGEQMAPGDMEPLASVSRSSAGGEP